MDRGRGVRKIIYVVMLSKLRREDVLKDREYLVVN